MIRHMKIWKPVVGYEDLYQVSSDGEVMRIGKGGAAIVGRILKPATDSDGYKRVALSKDGICVTKKLHRLVADALLGGIPNGYTVNHIDGVKANNCVSNLEIVTRGENISHAFQVIKTQNNKGENNGRANLTEADVSEIRKRLLSGENGAKIARDFNTTRHTISDIKRRKTWSHV